MCVFFFKDTCYYKMCCRCSVCRCRAAFGGVSWKNTTDPVTINHLPQFAIWSKISRMVVGGCGGAGASAEFFFRRTFRLRTCPVSFSVTGFSECRNNLRRLLIFFFFSEAGRPWKPARRFFGETNKCPGHQSSYKFLFFCPPLLPLCDSGEPSSASVLNNRSTSVSERVSEHPADPPFQREEAPRAVY